MAGATHGRMSFSTSALRQRDRFAFFCEEIVRRFAGLELDTQDRSGFHASIDGWSAGTVNVCLTTNSVLNTARTPQHVRDGNDGLCLMLLDHGVAHFQSAFDGPVVLGPGDAVLCDYGYPGAYNFAGYAQAWAIKLPRTALEPLLPKATRLSGVRLDRDPIAKKLLFGYLQTARSIDLEGTDRAGAYFGGHIVDLIALAMGAEGDARREAEDRGARNARRVAILREIDRRSGERRLSAAALALQFGVTPRYIHLLLEETGKSFTHHVLERRLEKVAALLRQPYARDRTIAAIALEAGFDDLSYFGRAFRRRYEATPSDVREAARRERRDRFSEER